MTFAGKYLDWNQKRIKGIVDFYSHKFFFYKTIADIGCGYADISGVLHRLGSDITAVDARQEHLKMALKKYPGIKTLKADLDRGWPFVNKKFDMILDLDLICHLNEFENHLKSVCAHTTHLVLETAVCDSDDPNKSIVVPENKGIYDLSVNGMSCRPSAAAIERVLKDCGMDFRRIDSDKYNSGSYVYNWTSKNNDECDINKRRIWFAVKNGSPIQFARPKVQDVGALKLLQKKSEDANSPFLETSQPFSIAPISSNFTHENKRFVIVIPSYNNIKWCTNNINSVLNQNYDRYRIIFTDDSSNDGTFDKVQNIVQESGKSNRITLIRNDVRKGALENLYNMINSCDDNEIILTLDGDDWFPDENVLTKLNDIYSKEDIWISYGQYKNFPGPGNGIASEYPKSVINANGFRKHAWGASHLRTFYAWLFKCIKKEDLMYKGRFMEMAWDMTIMYPMLEMAGNHSKFVSDILYVYNMDNPLNDHKVNQKLQQETDYYVRNKTKYRALTKPNLALPNVGLLLIATGKYDRFLQSIISSADNYFLRNDANVTYYVFTDSKIQISSKRNIVYIPIEHKEFPYTSLYRFHYFTNNKEKFNKENYLYYVDVDCLFVDNISTEIFGNLIGVQHCGFVGKPGPFEDNPKSSIYTDINRYSTYFGGGMSGGKKDKYLELSRWCSEMIDKDLANNIMPRFHDESVINKYFLDNRPDVTLSPSYHYPQGNLHHYKTIWGQNKYQAKILLLDKNHNEVRNT